MIAELLISAALAAAPSPTPVVDDLGSAWSVDPKSGLLLPDWAKVTRGGDPRGVAAWRAYYAVFSQTPLPTPTSVPAEACPALRGGHDWERLSSPPDGGVRCRRCGRWQDEQGGAAPNLPSTDILYAYMVRDAVDRGAWLTTRTATATPTPTRQPTPNSEATCVAIGHLWTTNWKDLRWPSWWEKENPRKGSLGAGDWPSEAHLEIVVAATKPDHDNAWERAAERCRRCKLWREKP